MNLSRRAKLDREAGARGERPKAPAAEPTPEPIPPTAPPPADEPPTPAPAVAAEPPKPTRFVRPAAEKRVAASEAALPPPSTKPAGQVMSRNLTLTPKGAAPGAKGPQPARGPIANSKKVSPGRRK